MNRDGENRILAFFANLPVALLGLFAPLIAKFGASPLLLPELHAAEAPVLREAQAEIPRLVAAIPVLSHAERAAQVIRDDLTGKLNLLTIQVTRFADDVYRAVVSDAALDQVLGKTPAEAQHAAYTRLLEQGVSGFTDSRGRNWELSAYVDMAVRTATMRAYNAARLAELKTAGFQYFIVSDDGRPCPLCLPWQNVVLTDGVPDEVAHHTIAEATAEGLFHPRCFPGYVNVSSPTGVSAADSRWYDGEVVVINTAGGNELAVTPNHPILTPEGWVAAGELVVGQHVFRHSGNVERVDAVRPYDERVEAPIGDVFESLREAVGVTTMTVPPSAEQFHGDGGHADVEVVFVDGLLRDGATPSGLEAVHNRELFVGGMYFADLVSESTGDELTVGLLSAPDSIMSGGGEGLTFCRAHAAHAEARGFAEVGADVTSEEPTADSGLARAEVLTDLTLGHPALTHGDSGGDLGGSLRSFATSQGVRVSMAPGDSGITNSVLHPRGADTEGGRELARRLAADISADEIVKVDRRNFSGHVYNLQTGDGWYVAESIVVHNCKHVLSGYTPGQVIPPPHEWGPEDQARYDQSQRQRQLERNIRAAKRELAGAYTPEMKTAATRKVRQAQAAMRDFIDQTGAVRIPRREQLHL